MSLFFLPLFISPSLHLSPAASVCRHICGLHCVTDLCSPPGATVWTPRWDDSPGRVGSADLAQLQPSALCLLAL